MKNAKFASIFILLLILITLLIVALWCILLPEDVKDAVGSFRWRRKMELPRSEESTPEWIEELIETNSNKTLARKEENVMVNALGQLQVSGPENIMAYITLESPCKKLKSSLNVFARYHKNVDDKNLYIRLFKAIKKFHSIYCGPDERYRKLFSEYQDELLGLHEQFVDCDGDPDWFENPNNTKLCADAESVVNCYVQSLKLEIGEVVSKAWKCIFTQVLNEVLLSPCNFLTKHKGINSHEVFGSRSSSISYSNPMLLLLLFVILVMSYFILHWTIKLNNCCSVP